MLKKKNIFFNKSFLIYGLGKSGISSFLFLKKNNEVDAYDDNNKLSINKKIKKSIIKLNEVGKKNYDFIVISPGIDIKKCKLKNYLSKNLIKIVTDLDVFYSKYRNNKNIVITGTNGKSTCVKLIFNILKDHKKDVRLVGNIGNPVLSERNIDLKTIFVIEASSYQIEYSRFFKAKYAAILNITPDHLERHGNFNNYAKAKLKLIKNQEKRSFSFIDFNSPYINKFIKKNRLNSKIIKIKKNSIKAKLHNIKNRLFLTKGNIQNLSFVFAIIKKLNLNAKKTLKTINNYKGLKFRQEIVFKSKNLTVINDSKATSFSSSENILKSLKNVYWILGGIPKKGDKFQMTRKECNSFKAYIFGNNKSFFIKNLRNKLAIQNFKNLKFALKKVINDIRLSKSTINHKTILFSPSAASFDSFRNFEDRGENFNKLVKKLNLRKI